MTLRRRLVSLALGFLPAGDGGGTCALFPALARHLFAGCAPTAAAEAHRCWVFSPAFAAARSLQTSGTKAFRGVGHLTKYRTGRTISSCLALSIGWPFAEPWFSALVIKDFLIPPYNFQTNDHLLLPSGSDTTRIQLLTSPTRKLMKVWCQSIYLLAPGCVRVSSGATAPAHNEPSLSLMWEEKLNEAKSDAVVGHLRTDRRLRVGDHQPETQSYGRWRRRRTYSAVRYCDLPCRPGQLNPPISMPGRGIRREAAA